MIKHKLLSVSWVDSRRSSDVYSVEEFKEFPLAIIESIGWGYEFKDKVVLAGDYHPELPEQRESYRDICSIPRECIKKVKIYEEIVEMEEK